jgi:hypothetical protein
MSKHAQLMGWSDHWGEDDFVVLDQEKSVGRIYKEILIGEIKWRWFVNTSPFPAPPPHSGFENSIEDAKTAFKKRYEEMKRAGVKPFV